MGCIGLSAVLDTFGYVLEAYKRVIIDFIGAPELTGFGISIITFALIYAFTRNKDI